jgi:type I restriction-modification system DNA methylase subunit
VYKKKKIKFMKNTDIYLWMNENQIPITMVEEINGEVWPIYNGKCCKGMALVNDLSKPEERVRLVVTNFLEKIKIKYRIEERTQSKGTQSVDIFCYEINKAFELKPKFNFDDTKFISELNDYLPFCKDTQLLTYDDTTKQLITKNIKGEKKYHNKMEEIIYEDSLIKETDLVNITNEAVPSIIGNMLEILYSNNVSDYTKGLDVIVKLLACKNIDEIQIHHENVMKIQVIKNESDEQFIHKIINLYVESAKEMNNSVDEKFMCTETLFYLIEVDDELTYKKNINILKLLVEQIQRYKFVKVGNVDFITQLFEELENNKTLKDYGIYITDSNITDFITKSLPIYEYIKETSNPKLRYQDPAVGTGHFPNSFMNEMSSVITKLKEENFEPKTKEGREFIHEFDTVDNIKRSYLGSHVVGIDVQKRNIELCRINTVLKNGTSIKCYHGNSLQKDVLQKKYPNSEDFQNNSVDVITSNYPFSVKGFSKDLSKEDMMCYDLTKKISDKAQQIENVFLEDTILKLKEGGIAGFVIFESVLWKSMSINNSLRYKMLVECELISVVKFGSEAFKNTSTKSVAIFLRKRKQSEIKTVKENVEKFFSNFQDILYKDTLIIDTYANEIHGFSHPEYVEFLLKFNNRNKRDNEAIKIEKEKLELFMLNYDRKILFSDLSFDDFCNKNLSKKQNKELRKKKQREVLGMSKSSYDEKKYENSEYLPKLSMKIKKMFQNIIFDDNLESFEKIYNICDVINFENNDGFVLSFDGDQKNFLSENFENYNFIKLSEIVKFHEKIKNRADDGIIGGQYPFYTCTSDDDEYKTTDTFEKEGEYVLINNGGESFFRLTKETSKWSASGDIIIMSSIHQTLNNKYISKFLKNNPKILDMTYKGSGLKHTSLGRLKKIMIPIMSEKEVINYINK